MKMDKGMEHLLKKRVIEARVVTRGMLQLIIKGRGLRNK
jgi:hypothetical protein